MKMMSRRFIQQVAMTFSLLFSGFLLSAQSISPVQIFQFSDGNSKTNTNSVPIVNDARAVSEPDLPRDAPQNQVQDFRYFKKVATNRKSSDATIFNAATVYLASWGLEENDFKPVNSLLQTNHAAYLVKLIRGHYFIELAWKERGSAYANQVGASQLTNFEEKLRKAEAELEAAWELNPKQPLIPEEMMTVELGQGKGRDRLELWFQRAVHLDTNNFRACRQKLYYLEPKWYGSPQDEIAFGRECVASTNWGGEIPLLLVQAHQSLAKYLPKEKQSDYWLLPGVWEDVQSAYNKYLKAHPKDLLERSYYAVFAYSGSHWDVLNEQLLLLGSENYRLLGDEDKISDIVGAAKRHAAKSN
ncbi:MAG: hypothetical protein ABJA67_17230 [Chthonomonadales bacterium]